MKTCSKCGETKELTEFHKRNNRKCGYASHCKVCVNTRIRTHRKNNPEKTSAQSKRYYENNKKYHKDYYKKYYETNKKQILEQQEKYRQSAHGKEIHRITAMRRRANKAAAFHFPYTTNELQKHWLMVGVKPNKCYYCEEGKFEHIDHYVPLSKGGPDAKLNLVPSCASCNLKKNAKLPQEFL